MLASRSDAALMPSEMPWDSLLDGVRADSFVILNRLGLAQYYRGLGQRIVISLDPTNGLNRASDADPLVARGRSLTEPFIRQLYRNDVVALDTLARPDYITVASETNSMAAMVAAHDERLEIAEAELLRAICRSPHCPLPPFLGGATTSD